MMCVLRNKVQSFPITILLIVVFISINRASEPSAKYSKEEIAALAKFRPLVENVLVLDYQRVDSYLIRWLRARQLNPNTAATMLRAAEKWRKVNKIDSILNEQNPFVQEFFESTDGIAKDGTPVLTVASGNVDLRKALLEGRRPQILRANFQVWEEMALKAWKISNRTGIDNSQVIFLGDLTGFNRKQHVCLQCISMTQDWIRALEDYYPGFRKWDILINVPMSYDLLIRNTAALISPETKAVIKAFGQNRTEWSTFLSTIIEPDQRSYRFGGTKTIKATQE